ncbi:MAG TPA: SH3 domain-containing protein [Gammaproteobacteria bacterium]|nr:SH3 domain-containing protein [Gammaproteobacteria bacterium]
MRRALVIGVLLLATLGVVQADSGGTAQTVVVGNMNDGPYSDANPIGSVPVNTVVTVLSRQGGWYKVRLPTGQTGWLPMTDLRLGNPSSGGSNAPKSSSSHGFFSLFESGRSGASGTTATTGVRGLNTGDIANAKPDPAAVAELDQWMVKPPVATAFAGEIKLKAEKLDYLPEVKQ